jgi:hypothetical protein
VHTPIGLALGAIYLCCKIIGKMKRILIIAVVIISAMVSNAQQLKSFDAIMDALKEGKTITAVFNYGECMLISDNEIEKDSIRAIGGMQLDTWEFFEEGAVLNKQAFVVSSTSKLIANPKGNGFVYNYGKVKIQADNSVKISVSYIVPTTFEETMQENFFTEINDGKKGGASFFINK